MKYVIIWIVGSILLTPTIVSICADSIICIICGVLWIAVMYLSGKTKLGYAFWKSYWKSNIKIILALENYGKKA